MVEEASRAGLVEHLVNVVIELFALVATEVEIRLLICQDKMSRQVEFWLDKFSGPSMIV